MKRFQFQLQPVLNYKQQGLDALMVELSGIQARVAAQENRRSAAYQRLADFDAEYAAKKERGLTVIEAMECQSCQQVLEVRAKREDEMLRQLREEEDSKRREVVEARKETHSLERLKEFRQTEYDAAARKEAEKTLDDLTASRHSALRLQAQAG